jgi:hypothetical protein
MSESHIDEARAVRQQLDDAWARNGTQFDTDIREIEHSNLQTAARWLERLRRLEEWRKQIGGLDSALVGVESTVGSLRWFDRAEALADPLAARLRRTGERLLERRDAFHQSLEIWESALTEKEAELKAFQERHAQVSGPLLVSRARRQPEAEFVEGGSATESELSATIAGLRRRLNHFLGRLYRAAQLLERRAEAYPGLFEVRKNQLLERLRATEKDFFALREAILADALYFEACRKKMRWISDMVKRMKCIEEVYRPPEPFWKRVWNQLTAKVP